MLQRGGAGSGNAAAAAGAASAAFAALTLQPSARLRGIEYLHAAELAAYQVVGARFVTPDLLKKAYFRELLGSRRS